MRRVVAPVLCGVMLAACATALLVGSGGCLNLLYPQTSTDVLREAARRARSEDRDAIVFAAEGLYGASFSGGSETLEYTFLATNPDNATTTWQLKYDRTSWTVTEVDSPFVGVAYYDLTQVEMSLDDARAILQTAGFEDNFQGWSLHQPLYGSPNPVYTFTYASKTVIIDTATEAVTVITHAGAASDTLLASPGEDSVSIEKVLAAGAEIEQYNQNAYIIWAGGRDGGGNPLNAPGDTNTWDFYAVENAEQLRAYTMRYDGQWSVAELAWPPLSIEYWDIAQIGMDVVEAWSKAADAGYPGPFNWWEAFKPLNPTVPNAVIVFGEPAGRRIVVDTVTGDVTIE